MKKTFTAARIGHIDSQGDVFLPGAFKIPEILFLSHNFDRAIPLGIVEACKEVGDELIVTADIPENMLHLIPAIGFQVIHQKKNQDGTKTIQEARLMEVSLVQHNVDTAIKPLKDQ